MPLRHICFISQEYPPDTGWGGVGSYTYEMAHALVEAGYRVTVIAGAIKQEQVIDDAGVDVHRVLPAPDWNSFPGLWRINRFWPGFAWSAMLRLRQIHRHCSIDVVEASEFRADSFFIPWLRNRPRMITRLHTAWILVDRLNGLASDRKKRFKYWLEQKTIQKADIITAPCQAMVDLTDTWLPLSRQQIRVVPNPVNDKIFAVVDVKRRHEVLFVGRLERRKGIEALALALPHVLRQCPQATFRFVGGDGVNLSGKSWRTYLVEDLTPLERTRVIFDQVSRDGLLELYQQAAICVMPSVWENFPYAVLEAMACGTPIVATRIGGLAELVEDGCTGLLVPPEHPQALADALCDLLSDPLKREEFGRNARKRAEHIYSVQQVVPKMLQVYESILVDSHRN